jgi:hypothetical protein
MKLFDQLELGWWEFFYYASQVYFMRVNACTALNSFFLPRPKNCTLDLRLDILDFDRAISKKYNSFIGAV